MSLHFALAFGLFTLCSSLGAQETEIPKPNGDEVRLKELGDELKRLDLELLELGIDSVLLGSSEPWPPSDPELSYGDWMLAIAEAPAVSISELLASLKMVDIDLVRTASLNAIVGDDDRDWVRPIAQAVQQQGLRIDARGDVHLRVHVMLGGGLVTTRQNGRAIGNYGAYTLRTDTNLALPARILRGTNVHHGDVEIVHLTSLNVLTTKPTKQMIVSVLQDNIASLFAKAAADQRSPKGKSAWKSWAKAFLKGPERFLAFRGSFHAKKANLDSGLGEIPGFRSLIANPVTSQGLFELTSILKPGALSTYWATNLAAKGISAELTEGPVLRHDWILSRYGQEDALRGAVATASRVAILDDDCLAVLNGEFVRYSGMGFVDRSGTDIALWEKVQRPIMNHLSEQTLRVTTAMRAGANVPVGAQHKHAPAVANFLRTRARTEVPDIVLMQLSNRIALALEAEPGIPTSFRRDCIESRDGQTTYLLSRVGDARSAELIPKDVQNAIRKALNNVQFSDPIALYAFDNPFNFNTDGDYTILPAEYPQRFKRMRPAGRSALAGEHIVNAEKGFYRISRYYSSDRLALGKHKETIAAHQILMASYHDPEDGPGSAQSQYFFWYGKAPDNWGALLAKLPTGHGLKRMGPPCTGAPDTIQEAKQQLADYQIQLGL